MSDLHYLYAIRYSQMDVPSLLIKEIDWCNAQIKRLFEIGKGSEKDIHHFVFIRSAAVGRLIELGYELPQSIREKYHGQSVGSPCALSELI